MCSCRKGARSKCISVDNKWGTARSCLSLASTRAVYLPLPNSSLPPPSPSICPLCPTTQSSDRLSRAVHSLQSVVSLCRHCCRCHRALLRWWHATCAAGAAAAARTKQTIRFYCFLVCEKLRGQEKEEEKEELLLLLLQVAAGCCLLLWQRATSRSLAKLRLSVPPPCSLLPPLPPSSPCLLPPPLAVLPHLVETLANKGVARAVKMSNYFAKMLHNSRVLCHQLTHAPQSPSLSLYSLSSRLSCCQSSRCATCPAGMWHMQYGN